MKGLEMIADCKLRGHSTLGQSPDTIRWSPRQVQYQKGTLFASIITLANSVGAGVLTFPYAFESTGLVLPSFMSLPGAVDGVHASCDCPKYRGCAEEDSPMRSYQDVVKLAMGERSPGGRGRARAVPLWWMHSISDYYWRYVPTTDAESRHCGPPFLHYAHRCQ